MSQRDECSILSLTKHSCRDPRFFLSGCAVKPLYAATRNQDSLLLNYQLIVSVQFYLLLTSISNTLCGKGKIIFHVWELTRTLVSGAVIYYTEWLHSKIPAVDLPVKYKTFVCSLCLLNDMPTWTNSELVVLSSCCTKREMNNTIKMISFHCALLR